MAEAAKPSPSTVAANNWTAFQAAYDAVKHDNYIKLADKCDEFYVGDQWDPEVVRALGDRPALTINLAARTINAIVGHYSTSRADIMFKPRRNATEQQARTLSQLIDQILTSNKYARAEKQVFEDGVIADRGYFDVRMSFDDNVLGEAKVTSRDPRTVVPDPNATEYDPSTWSQVFTHDWHSIDDLEALYGEEKVRELYARVEQGDTYGAKSIRFSGTNDVVPNDPEERRRVRAVRVVERQYRRLAKVREFVDLNTGDTREVPEHWDEGRVKAVKETYGLAIRTRMVSRIRWTVTADNVVLFDDWSPYEHFTIVPFFPYFRRGKPCGVMRHLLSPQEQLNKTESQELHIVNTTANSGWLVEEGSLVNMSSDELEGRAAETGLVLTYRRNRTPPQKIKPNSVPTGVDRIAQKAAQYVLEIPGAAPLVGQSPKSDVSGVAIQDSKTAALTGLQPVFDNLQFTREMLAERLLSLVQRFYTEPRLLRVTDWSSPEEASAELQINTDILNNVTLGEYDIVVASAPARDTFEDTQFAQALELKREGIMIPDHYVILASHLAQKKEIAELVKQMQGLGEPTEEQSAVQQMQMELEIRRAMAELSELEAKVVKTQAEAQATAAKGQAALIDAQSGAQKVAATAQQEQQALVADIQKTIASLQNKLELAGMHINAKNQLTRYNRVSAFAEKMIEKEHSPNAA